MMRLEQDVRWQEVMLGFWRVGRLAPGTAVRDEIGGRRERCINGRGER